MSIADNVRSVEERIAAAAQRAGRAASEVTLVAVTKGMDAASVREAFQAGVRQLGENRLQEAEGKLPALQDIRAATTWHMIGHLQTNKVKSSIQVFDIIQSVDSVRLGEALDKRDDGPVRVFLEVNVSGEASRSGFRPGEVAAALEEMRRCRHLDIRGLMTIAPMVDEPEQARPVFRELRQLGKRLGLSELSMGMTGDFEVAVEEGATMVRVGTAIFGPRPGSRDSSLRSE